MSHCIVGHASSNPFPRYDNSFRVPNLQSSTVTKKDGDIYDPLDAERTKGFLSFDVGELEPPLAPTSPRLPSLSAPINYFRNKFNLSSQTQGESHSTSTPEFGELDPTVWPDDPQWDVQQLSSQDAPFVDPLSEPGYYESTHSSSVPADVRQMGKSFQLPPYLMSPYFLPFPSTHQTPNHHFPSQFNPLAFQNPKSLPPSPAAPPADPYSISHVLPPLSLPSQTRSVPSVYYVHDPVLKSRNDLNHPPEKPRSRKQRTKKRRHGDRLNLKSNGNKMRGTGVGLGKMIDDHDEDEAKHDLPIGIGNRRRPFSALQRASSVASDDGYSSSDYNSSDQDEDTYLVHDCENLEPLPATVPVSRSGKKRISKVRNVLKFPVFR